MSTLIIDQIKEIFKKTKSIFSWHSEDEEDKKDKTVPIILAYRPGTVVNDNQIVNRNVPSNINKNVVFWTDSAISESKQNVKVKTLSFKKLIKFMRRNRRSKARGA